MTTPAQQYSAALTAGIAITSASRPDYSATYALAEQDQINLLRQRIAVMDTAFPARIYDATGALHNMAAGYFAQTFYPAVMAYLQALNDTLQNLTAGGSASWPSASVVLA
jgi:hypothetical protein